MGRSPQDAPQEVPALPVAALEPTQGKRGAMTGVELLAAALQSVGVKIQPLYDVVLGAKMRKDGSCRVEFETVNLTANDLMFFASPDKPVEREPKYIGVILWMPFAEYMALSEPESPRWNQKSQQVSR